MYNRYYAKGEKDLSYDGILLSAMQNFGTMIFEYMNETYELIDDQVLEEFKACLYKACAFQCGVHLAFCFLRSSENPEEKIKEIHEELTTGGALIQEELA